jgi:hypothetical protein
LLSYQYDSCRTSTTAFKKFKRALAGPKLGSCGRIYLCSRVLNESLNLHDGPGPCNSQHSSFRSDRFLSPSKWRFRALLSPLTALLRLSLIHAQTSNHFCTLLIGCCSTYLHLAEQRGPNIGATFLTFACLVCVIVRVLPYGRKLSDWGACPVSR